MFAHFKLTKTMIDKHIIDCNKTIREFIYSNFGIRYEGDFLNFPQSENPNRFTISNKGVYYDDYRHYDGVENNFKTLPCDINYAMKEDTQKSSVKFYMTKRGDKRLSIKNIKKYAKVGDTIWFECTGDNLHLNVG